MDQPGMVANFARSEMNRYEMLYFNVNQIKEVGDPSRDAYRYNVPVLYCTVLYHMRQKKRGIKGGKSLSYRWAQ